jgi:hypothetical protein
MKKTAVEWLEENLITEPYSEQDFKYNSECWNKAKEMFKKQIEDAYKKAEDNCEWLIEEHRWERFHSEQYYNETFS